MRLKFRKIFYDKLKFHEFRKVSVNTLFFTIESFPYELFALTPVDPNPPSPLTVSSSSSTSTI